MTSPAPQLLHHNAAYDVQQVRRDFPILARQVHNCPLVYLDNAASAQKPACVIESMRQFYEQDYANIHRGVHYLSSLSTARFEEARESVRSFINAASVNEIIFTRGATESANLLAQTFGRRFIRPGEAIVVSQLEHHANIVPWQLLASERGCQLKVAPIDASGQIILEAYEKLLTPEVKLVAMTHMSNALGTITPAARLVELAHAKGIPVLLDGAQAVCHLPVDVQALDVDFYMFSGHKIYGPTGIGILYGKLTWLDQLPPWQGGGDMIETVSFSGTTYRQPPQRFEAGTPAIAQAIGLARALDYVSALGRPAIHAHEQALLDQATQMLSTIPGLHVYGTAANKGAVLSFTLEGAHPQDIALLLDQQGVAIRTGHHCCMPLMAHLGISGTCRASFALYNTPEEVEALAAAVRKAARMLT